MADIKEFSTEELALELLDRRYKGVEEAIEIIKKQLRVLDGLGVNFTVNDDGIKCGIKNVEYYSNSKTVDIEFYELEN